MIENLLNFLKYFDDKVNSMKNMPLGFVKVQSTHLSLVYSACDQKGYVVLKTIYIP